MTPVESGLDLLLSRQAKALDAGNFVEEVGDRLLVDLEGQVADEKSVALGAKLVVELLGTVVGATSSVVVGLASRQVDSHVTTIEEGTVLLIQGSLGVLGRVKVNVAEATGAAIIAASHDASARDTLAVLELLVQEVVIDVPAQVADEQRGALSGGLLFIGLALLGGSLGGVLGLALLGGSLSLLLRRLGLRLVRAAGLGIGIALGSSGGVGTVAIVIRLQEAMSG